MKKGKFLIGLILILVMGAIGANFFSSKRDNEIKEKEFVTAQAEQGTIQVYISCTGKVVSNQDVEIKSKASGKVIKLPFSISDTVQASNLLVELDPTDEQRNVEKAESTLEAAIAELNAAKQALLIDKKKLKTARMKIKTEISSTKAEWEDAENKANREEQLYQKKLSSREELDTRKTEAIRAKATYEKTLVKQEELKTQTMELELKKQTVEVKESKVRSATIDLEIANQRLNDTRILSPIDGIVTEKNIQIGQIISSGINNIGGGTTIMVLSDLSKIYITASVDESDIGKIRLDQEAEITVDSYPDTSFMGKIVRIAPRGINIHNVVTFDVKIEILSRNKSLLKPEMTANVKIISAKKQNVLLIPGEAVEFSNQGPKVTLLLANKNTIDRKIQLGLNNGEVAEIVKGLKEGDTVILNPGQVRSKWSNTKKSNKL